MKNLNEMTPEELYALNLPLLAKIYNREELTAEEQDLHQAIVMEASRQHEALRLRELQEREEWNR